jgi:tetratricopeptide (TPR) repeat protein
VVENLIRFSTPPFFTYYHDADSILKEAFVKLLTLAVLVLPCLSLAQNSKQKRTPQAARNIAQSAAAPAEQVAPKTPTIEPAHRVKLSSTNTIRVNYTFRDWNKSPTQVDSASILMREGESGRIVQIFLEETAPDSSVFSGLYSINWQNLAKLQVEFYTPPQELLRAKDGLIKIVKMITNHELKRHPFILRKTLTGEQDVEIFDTREQSIAALKAYHSEQQVQAVQNQNQIVKTRKFPSDSEIDTAILADDIREHKAAAASYTDRVRLEQNETKRLEDLAVQFNALSNTEKSSRQVEARKQLDVAMALYRKDKFEEADPLFQKAIDLDPNNQNYYFQYGVSLNRLQKYNLSIVFLNLAKDSSVDQAEKNYYTGLDFYQLKEYANSRAAFEKVVQSKNSPLTPSARFYQGLIAYDQHKWEDSKVAFQAVLDSSKDPVLDKSAEAYVEAILRALQFEAERARKWQLSATIGEMYDPNVLLTSDSLRDQGQATDLVGYRTLFTGSARYRPVYEENREFAAQLDVLSMYSIGNSLKTSKSLRNADPNVITLTTPWTQKGVLLGKGHKFDLIPGYETTIMSIEDNKNKVILNSFFVDFNNMLVMRERWYANYNLEIRDDIANLNAAVGDDDSSAYKLKLAFNNLVLVDDARSKMVIANSSYTNNSAKGKNSIYNRVDLGTGYIQPFYWNTSANAQLGYFLLNYPQKTIVRTDNSYTLSVGATKPLNEIYSMGLLATYNINNSTDATNQYKKLTVLVTFSSLYAF